MEGPGDNSADGTLGRITLKQVRVSRQELEARKAAAAAANTTAEGEGESRARSGGANPMNRLVPYLDLFERLDDEELSRLARVPTSVVSSLRKQVDEINVALARYVDLLPRLRDEELIRLTGASAKTIQFWRLCQPRGTASGSEVGAASAARVTAKPAAEPADPVEPPPDPSDSVVGAVEEIAPEDSGTYSEAATSGLHEISGEPFDPLETSAKDHIDDVDDELDAMFADLAELGDER